MKINTQRLKNKRAASANMKQITRNIRWYGLKRKR